MFLTFFKENNFQYSKKSVFSYLESIENMEEI